jgi:hypothetical protein
MSQVSYKLIDERSILSCVIEQSLTESSSSSDWAEQTNHLALNSVEQLTEMYGEVWCYGYLPQKFLFQIRLPEHKHSLRLDSKSPISFPPDTTLEEAVHVYDTNQAQFDPKCFSLISFLKEQIRAMGFSTVVSLAVIHNELKHIDGLHRLIGLGSLVKEGYKYEPIPVYLCRKD